MDRKKLRTISTFISLVLRHQPETADLMLDEAGWAGVDELLAGLRKAGREVTREQLEEVVAENDKQRFQFDDSGIRIRATQGHSVDVELGYDEAVPPAVLCHGTPEKFVEPILREGLTKQQRHHVHLHEDVVVAAKVGQRRGKSVILTIDAQRMSKAGHVFYVTPNLVWLTDHVPPEFISASDNAPT